MTTLAYARWDFLRNIRMVESAVFVLLLPVAMYLIFGALSNTGDIRAGHGNVPGYNMISLGAYGAIIAMTSIAGFAAVERSKGWTRQLALTRLTSGGYLLGKVLVGVGMALAAVLAVFLAGLLTGAELDGLWRWVGSMVLCVVAALPFAFYGLAAALLFRSEAAVSASSGLLVVLSFLGNLFIPLNGVMLTIAKFTPVYGVASLARWLQLEGTVVQFEGTAETDPLWLILLNVGTWTLIFLGLCVLGARRSTART